MSAEQRERMTETFVAVNDALRWDKVPDMPRPWYLPAVPPQTVSQYRAVLARWTKLGIVKVH